MTTLFQEWKMDVAKATLWDFVKGVCSILFVFGLSLKIYNMTIAVNVDFPTLLSLVLALFSVALSALFYFKATETSNTFYDNTYKFTRDTAQLLAKMESGFGERLRNLDEGYSSMRGYMQNGFSPKAADDPEVTAAKLRAEKEEMQKVVDERNKIVEDLIERSQLEAEEKNQIVEMLKAKESELSDLQKEVNKLNNRRTFDRVRMRAGAGEGLSPVLFSNIERYTRGKVIHEIGGAERIAKRSVYEVKRAFESSLDNFSGLYLRDMREAGYLNDSGLTKEGAIFVREVAKEQIETTQE
jgi:hypothetical protein